MNYKNRLKRANQKMRRKAQEDRDVRMFHSASYHRFFEGYTEYETVNAKGKKVLKRVYTGIWYVQDLATPNYFFLRALYCLLFAGIVLLFSRAGMTQQESGTALYVVLPEIATVCFLFYLLYTLFVGYLFVPRKMTVHDYRSSSLSLKKASKGMGICLFADTALTVLYLFLHRGTSASGAGAAALEFLGAALLAGAMCLIECKIPYKEVENDTAPEQSGIVIDSE